MKGTFRISNALLMLATLSSLAACQTTRMTAMPDKAVCAVFPPITYSGKSDTEATKLQVRQFNAARDSYCRGKP